MRQIAKLITIPAPKRGWNARDPLSAMKPDHAVVLENLIPGTGGVDPRNGYKQQATGIGARVNSLMQCAAAPPAGYDPWG